MSPDLAAMLAVAEDARPDPVEVDKVLATYTPPEPSPVEVELAELTQMPVRAMRSAAERIRDFYEHVPRELHTLAPVPEIAAMLAFDLPVPAAEVDRLHAEYVELVRRHSKDRHRFNRSDSGVQRKDPPC